MKFAKGTRPTGRQKGTGNKVSSDVRGMVLKALHGAGGASYLEEQAIKNPKAFMGLLGKVLPTTITTNPDEPMTIKVTWEK